MPENKYSATNIVVFSQQIESGQHKQFMDVWNAAVKHAEKNNLTKPKKQDVLSKVFKEFLPTITPDFFFK